MKILSGKPPHNLSRLSLAVQSSNALRKRYRAVSLECLLLAAYYCTESLHSLSQSLLIKAVLSHSSLSLVRLNRYISLSPCPSFPFTGLLRLLSVNLWYKKDGRPWCRRGRWKPYPFNVYWSVWAHSTKANTLTLNVPSESYSATVNIRQKPVA